MLQRQRAALQRQLFFEDTQAASDVLRRRIRHYRQACGLTQGALAQAMSELDVPLTHKKVSLIEGGKRRVRYDELLAFADVLRVPLGTLMSPVDGERPIRAGGIGLEHHEVVTWVALGDTKQAALFTVVMDLTRRIQTMVQVIEEENDPSDPEASREHYLELRRLLEELRSLSMIPPGIMERQALRERMAAGPDEDAAVSWRRAG